MISSFAALWSGFITQIATDWYWRFCELFCWQYSLKVRSHATVITLRMQSRVPLPVDLLHRNLTSSKQGKFTTCRLLS